MKRALLSVSDKVGIVDFAQQLVELGYELLSTGGTKAALQEAGIPVTAVGDVTGFPEILEGRVKTLHPKIHGGLLSKHDDPAHLAQLEEHAIQPIQVVCVNLYPFQSTIQRPDVTPELAIENIDIGGPSMLRASAKNHQYVTVVTDPADYAVVLDELRTSGETKLTTRQRLAAKVFRHTASYDAWIAAYLSDMAGDEFPESLTLTYEKKQDLRYGENPHQLAAFYQNKMGSAFSIAAATQVHGKELSYNNIQDANAAIQLVKEFDGPAAVAVKHMNPCGVGVGKTIAEAFQKAYESDETSIFGGIIALNREVDAATAKVLGGIFLEIIIAPSFSEQALAMLTAKKNIRLLTIPFEDGSQEAFNVVSIEGGLLVQSPDTASLAHANVEIVTDRAPTDEEWAALELGWNVVKHVKSNAIVVSDAQMTLGVGAGQMNRVGAAKIALEQAGDKARGSALASDAFFPMSDTVETAAAAGITAIIQPGGSVKDQDSIDKANELGIAMVFTGIRHFKH